jgi:hypothetical protein
MIAGVENYLNFSKYYSISIIFKLKLMGDTYE